MLSHLSFHDQALSSCGIPLISELLHVCLSDPQPLQLEQALVWLGLLQGVEELERVFSTASPPMLLAPDQVVALYAAIHLSANPTQPGGPLHTHLAGFMAQCADAKMARPSQLMNQVLERAESSHWAELIRQTSLLHLSDPTTLFADFLAQLETFFVLKMPFAALLRLSILLSNPEKLPEGWQARLAEPINALGDLADAIPLYRFWMVVCQVAPDWDFACIRAADLALRFEDFAVAEQLLDLMEPTNIHNPWFYDVKARCRYAYGDLRAAARLWSVALMKIDAFAQQYQILHNRLLLALRGKFGFGEIVRLSRCGQNEEALQLLRIVILHDPGFASNYTLLDSLSNCNELGETASVAPTVDLQSVERLTERFQIPPSSRVLAPTHWCFVGQLLIPPSTPVQAMTWSRSAQQCLAAAYNWGQVLIP